MNIKKTWVKMILFILVLILLDQAIKSLIPMNSFSAIPRDTRYKVCSEYRRSI